MSSSNGATAQNTGEAVVTVGEFNYKRVSTASGTSKSISGSRSILREIVVNTALINAVTVNDDTVGVFVIPTTVVAGDKLFYGDVTFKTNINITHSASAGDLTFIFKSF